MSNIIYKGIFFTVEAAIRNNGSIPAIDFIKSLPKKDRVKLEALFRTFGDRGLIRDERKFKKLEGDIWEFKSFQIRLLCYRTKNRLIILTHGFYKKANKTKKSEIEKAIQIRREYETLKEKGF